ncbi:MAG: hypothetical protein JW963_25075 [Anaerolineales bacterium]|nr:hypothetical protein [Anaerolineales bacterium]
MDKNKPHKADEDIVREFDRLFDEIPEPSTDEEIENYLIDSGYNIDDLKVKGLEFIRDLIANNWRFTTSDEIDKEATEINKIPLREDWERNRLLQAIRKASEILTQSGGEPVLAFRNLENLTERDLASVLQELEYKANSKGVKLDLG